MFAVFAHCHAEAALEECLQVEAVAEYANWYTPEYETFPDGTYTNYELVISFRYPDTAGKFGMNIRSSCESGKVTFKKVFMRERAEKYMDNF